MGNYQRAGTSVVTLSPPDLVESVMNVYRKAKRKPRMFPADTTAAAKFWITQQEKPNEFTERVEPIEKDGEAVGWKTPYHDRVIANLRTFLREDHLHQVYIIEQIESGIPWRGDKFDFYRTIVAETLKMRADPESYRGVASTVLKDFRKTA